MRRQPGQEDMVAGPRDSGRADGEGPDPTSTEGFEMEYEDDRFSTEHDDRAGRRWRINSGVYSDDRDADRDPDDRDEDGNERGVFHTRAVSTTPQDRDRRGRFTAQEPPTREPRWSRDRSRMRPASSFDDGSSIRPNSARTARGRQAGARAEVERSRYASADEDGPARHGSRGRDERYLRFANDSYRGQAERGRHVSRDPHDVPFANDAYRGIGGRAQRFDEHRGGGLGGWHDERHEQRFDEHRGRDPRFRERGGDGPGVRGPRFEERRGGEGRVGRWRDDRDRGFDGYQHGEWRAQRFDDHRGHEPRGTDRDEHRFRDEREWLEEHRDFGGGSHDERERGGWHGARRGFDEHRGGEPRADRDEHRFRDGREWFEEHRDFGGGWQAERDRFGGGWQAERDRRFGGGWQDERRRDRHGLRPHDAGARFDDEPRGGRVWDRGGSADHRAFDRGDPRGFDSRRDDERGRDHHRFDPGDRRGDGSAQLFDEQRRRDEQRGRWFEQRDRHGSRIDERELDIRERDLRFDQEYRLDEAEAVHRHWTDESERREDAGAAPPDELGFHRGSQPQYD